MCNRILSVILGCGELDVNFLVKKIEEWDIEIYDIVEDIKTNCNNINANSIIYQVHNYHTIDVKAWISNLLEENEIEFDKDKLEEYEISIYTNFLDSGYDDKYQFWNVDNEDELQKNLSEVIDFLIDENIVKIEKEELEEELLILV
jgi:hypothetical protein